MRKKMTTAALGIALLGTLAGGSALAQQPVEARVVSTTQVTEPGGRIGYNVTYEYQGREYTTYSNTQPGRTIQVDVNAYGVTTSPVAPQAQLSNGGAPNAGNPWDHVVPERGTVVSSAQPAPAPTYYAAPVYAPAPLYAPAPVYVAPAYGYGYGYAPAYAYPPVGVSLNLGYSRGWGGHGRWR